MCPFAGGSLHAGMLIAESISVSAAAIRVKQLMGKSVKVVQEPRAVAGAAALQITAAYVQDSCYIDSGRGFWSTCLAVRGWEGCKAERSEC